jgi:DNA-binding NarL/FixJ family response regulator
VNNPEASPDSPIKIKVGIVDDDPLVRSALGLMLGGQADIEVVGEATDGQEALTLVRTVGPDVVLMDIRMPRVNGLEATRRVLAEAKPPHVIVLTTFGADEYVVDALAVGRGLSNAEIAKELYLSIPTVKAHVSRLFDKLGATNRVQIAITVHDAGLV